jgi:hypothetical protein
MKRPRLRVRRASPSASARLAPERPDEPGPDEDEQKRRQDEQGFIDRPGDRQGAEHDEHAHRPRHPRVASKELDEPEQASCMAG